MDLGLRNKNVLITGSTAGIGRRIANLFRHSFYEYLFFCSWFSFHHTCKRDDVFVLLGVFSFFFHGVSWDSYAIFLLANYLVSSSFIH